MSFPVAYSGESDSPPAVPSILLVPASPELLERAARDRDAFLAEIGARSMAEWPGMRFLLSQGREQLLERPELQGWWLELIVDAELHELVGVGGFKGPPDADGIVDLEVFIAPAREGRGYATSALQQLTSRAFSNPLVKKVRARTLPQAGAPTRMLEKAGFKFIEELDVPDDGPVWSYEIDAPKPASLVPEACSACGGALVLHLLLEPAPETGTRYSILTCTSCGLSHTAPTEPRPLDIHRVQSALFPESWTRRRLLLLKEALGATGGRLLDVGPEDPGFQHAAHDIGYAVETASAVSAESGPYRVITFWHSLGQAKPLLGTLRAAREALEPQGMLFVTVPDAGSLQARVFGPRWFEHEVPRNLHHFDRASLHTALGRAGFSDVQIHHLATERELVGWVRDARDAVLGERRRSVLRSLAVGAAMVPGAAVATALGRVVDKGATLFAVARSPARPE